MALSAQQEKFCQAYVEDIKRNGTQAAIAAGYSDKTATVQASRLLRNVNVKARIRELEREALETAGFAGDLARATVMRELFRIGLSDITDVVQISPDSDDPKREEVLDAIAEQSGGQRILDFGKMLAVPTPNLSPDVTAAIKGIKCKTDKFGTIVGLDVDMYDKLPALRLMAEVLDIVKGESVNVNVNVSETLDRARRRARQAAMSGRATGAENDAGGG